MAADESRLNRIENKVDVIVDRLGDTNVILAAQHESLKEHMKRSAMLEEALKPIQTHVNMVQGIVKFLALLAAIGAAVAAFVHR